LEYRRDFETTWTRPRVLYISGLNEAAAQGPLACASGPLRKVSESLRSGSATEAKRMRGGRASIGARIGGSMASGWSGGALHRESGTAPWWVPLANQQQRLTAQQAQGGIRCRSNSERQPSCLAGFASEIRGPGNVANWQHFQVLILKRLAPKAH
jgi:hypothetical protein